MRAEGQYPGRSRQPCLAPTGHATSLYIAGFDGGGAIASLTGPTGHVNFFQNLEDGEKLSKVFVFLHTSRF